MIRKDRLVLLTQNLIRIDTQNPPGNERSAAGIIKNILAPLGLKVELKEYERNRTNLKAILNGTKPGKTLIINTHIDTVPAGSGWKYPPFEGKINKDRIYGRGATDCKGNTAAVIEAINSIVEDKKPIRGKLIFVASADEEAGSQSGLKPHMDDLVKENPDAALVVDSENFNIDIAQKGLIHFIVKIKGKKAHGAYPHLGKNAISMAAEIITTINQLKLAHKPHKYLAPPTINIGTIKGGEKINMVPDYCEFGVDLRFLPGMDKDKILHDVKSAIEKTTKDYVIEIESILDPFELEKDDPLIRSLADSITKIRKKVNYTGVDGATMVTAFRDQKIPSVATGFGLKEQMHATDEYANIDDLVDGAKVIEDLILNYLK